MAKSAAETEVKLDWKAQKEEQARIRKRQNDLKKVEDEIHKLETRDGEIDELLSQEEIYTDVARLVELNNEKESLQKKLKNSMKPGRSWQNNLPAPFFCAATAHSQSHGTHDPAPRSDPSHSQYLQTCAGLRRSGRFSPESPSEHLHGSGSSG